MNTGLQDVWNQAWKLDLAVRVHANEILLENYTSERRPVIKGSIATADLLTRIMGTPSKLAQVLRDTIFPVVSRLSPLQRRFVQNLSELGISYRDSPMIPGPGDRYFDDSIRGGQGIVSRFLLLLGEEARPSTKEPAAKFSESRKDLLELRLAQGTGIRLLRPDGYLAFAGESSDLNTGLESIRTVLKQQR